MGTMGFRRRPLRCLARAIRLATLVPAIFALASARSEDELWVHPLGVDEGLSQNFITAIAQDQDGFMWFGTLSGLNRWDGYELRVFTHARDEATSLSDSLILALHADRANKLLWVGTSKGIDRFDPGANAFQRYGSLLRMQPATSPVRVQRITSDAAGRVWFASCDGPRLYRLDPRQGRVSEYLIAGTAKQLVTALQVDQADRLWVAMQAAEETPAPEDRGCRVFVFDRCSELSESQLASPRQPFRLDVEGGQVVAVIEDRSHRLWFGRDGGGLLRFDPQTGAVNRLTADPMNPEALAHGLVRGVGLDLTGGIWVLTQPLRPGSSKEPGQLHRVDPETLAARRFMLRRRTLQPGDDVRLEHLAIDHSGVLWLGSNAGGLRHGDVSSGGFSVYREGIAGSPGLNRSFVRAICQGRDGTLWVGTPGGLNRVERSKEQVRYSCFELTNPDVQAICEDRRGNLWIGTSRGVAVVEQASGRTHSYRSDANRPGSLSDDYVQVIHEDHDGQIWLGTLGKGLDEFDPRTRSFTNHPTKPGDPASLPHGTIYALLSDHRHALWVGTAAGLARLDAKASSQRRFERIATDPSALGSEAILAICECPATPDVLWIGTAQRGLCRLEVREGRCRFYTSRNSNLPDNTVYGILADRRGRLWMSTNRGLVRYDPASETYRTYGPQDGLQSREFNGRACFQGPDGEMFFGGVGGLNSFFPEQITDNPYAPKVLVTGVHILDRRTPDPDKASRPIYRHGMPRQAAALSPWQREITFDFVALHYGDPEGNRYQYKRENYDDDWRGPVAERRVRYTNLDPGSYTFRVKARSSHGVWSAEEASFAFVVLPPFYAAGWFRLLAALAILSAGAGAYRWRVRSLHQRQRGLEREVHRRTEELQRTLATIEEQAQKLKELDSVKSKFFANISHEFRTPLTLTLGPLRDVQAGLRGSIPAEARAEIELAIRNTNRQLELVDQLLLLARLDAGQANFRPRTCRLDEFLRLAAAPYESLAKRQQTQFCLDLPDHAVHATFDEGKMEHVIGNLLGNAFKFTPAGGTVTLRLTAVPDDRAIIEVEDTGPGIPARDLPHIFERFYRGEQEAGSAPGAGIGLSLAKEIVELHGGEIRGENRPEGGTRFTVGVKKAPPPPPRTVDIPVGDAAGSKAGVTGPADFPVGNSEDPDAPEQAGRPKVLLVEDHADMRAFLRRHLAPYYDILEATRGDDGLLVVRTEMPDVVVSDVMMPGMDGYALCRAIKSDPETDCIPVFLLTAKVSAESKLEGLEGGADDYIPKPFDPTEVRLRVRNLLLARTRLRARFASRSVEPVRPADSPVCTGPAEQPPLLGTDVPVGDAVVSEAGGTELCAPIVPAPLPLKSSDDVFRDRLRDALGRESHQESFDVAAFARTLGMSRVQLHRRVKEACNSTPAEVIIRFRLERAAQMLAQQTGNVAEVAYAVGFKNLSHFAKRFREHLHQTPAAYAAARKPQARVSNDSAGGQGAEMPRH